VNARGLRGPGWLLVPWLVVAGGCDTVFGLTAPDTADAPSDTGSDSSPPGPDASSAMSCAGDPTALLCADFDTPATGLGQFTIINSVGANVMIGEEATMAPTPPNALRARINAASPEYVLATAAVPQERLEYVLDLDFEATSIGSCPTVIAYLDYRGASDYTRRVYLAVKRDALIVTIAQNSATVITSVQLNAVWTGWTHVRLRLHPSDPANTVVVEAGALMTTLADAGFNGVSGTRPDLKFGAAATCVTAVLLDRVVLHGL
jgi:hypothetical protein